MLCLKKWDGLNRLAQIATELDEHSEAEAGMSLGGKYCSNPLCLFQK